MIREENIQPLQKKITLDTSRVFFFFDKIEKLKKNFKGVEELTQEINLFLYLIIFIQ